MADVTWQIAAIGVIGNDCVKPRIAGNYGDDRCAWSRNFTGIWASTHNDVIYFANGNASPLNGGDFFTATFTRNDRPDAHLQYFWSVICVDAVNVRVIPNAKNRFPLNKQSHLERGRDGSLTQHFAPRYPATHRRTIGCRHRQGSGTC